MPKSASAKKEATAEVFSMAFEKLGKTEKLRVIDKLLENPSIKKDKNIILLKHINNRRLMEDLYDLALIEEAKKEKGKSMTLDEYLKHRKAKLFCAHGR